MTKRQQRLFFILSTLLLTVQFKTNLVRVVGDGRFQNFAGNAGAFVVGRLGLSEQRGLFSEGGLIGWDEDVPEGVRARNYQSQIYFEDVPIRRYVPYASGHGFPALVFGLIDRLSPLEDRTNHRLFLWLSASFSAVVLSLFLAWTANTFGLFLATFCLLCISMSPWIVVSAGHLYWISGSLFIPFVVGLRLHQREKEGSRISSAIFLGVTALGVFVKCLFNGYELITSVLVLSVIPVFFYAVLDRWQLGHLVSRFLLVSCASLGGVLLSLGLLIFQIDQAESMQVRGIDHIQQRFLVRTVGQEPERIDSRWEESVAATRLEVVRTYLNAGAFFRGARKRKVVVRFRFMIGLFVLLSLAQLLLLKDALMKPLLVAGYLGLLSPLSWFVVFKTHSYLHVFLNSLSWYLPFMLLLYVGVGYAIRLLWGRVTGSWTRA